MGMAGPPHSCWTLVWLVALVGTPNGEASANRFRLPSLLSSGSGLTPAHQSPVVVRTQQLAQVCSQRSLSFGLGALGFGWACCHRTGRAACVPDAHMLTESLHCKDAILLRPLPSRWLELGLGRLKGTG